MAIDRRILARFEEEFAASKSRAVGYQATLDDLNNKRGITRARLDDELTIQNAINTALHALGQAQLS